MHIDASIYEVLIDCLFLFCLVLIFPGLINNISSYTARHMKHAYKIHLYLSVTNINLSHNYVYLLCFMTN